MAMKTTGMSKEVYVLCDHDALYAAIELKLSGLAQVHVLRRPSHAAALPDKGRSPAESDLIIVAPVPPIRDPMAILARASLLGCVGKVPVLVISEQPSRPQSDDKITYLNFPFDMDDLNRTVVEILGQCSSSEPEPIG